MNSGKKQRHLRMIDKYRILKRVYKQKADLDIVSIDIKIPYKGWRIFNYNELENLNTEEELLAYVKKELEKN